MAPSRFIALFSEEPESLYRVAEMLAPRVERCPPDGLILQVAVRYEQETIHRISHLAERNFKIGVASTRVVAILAARVRPGTFVPYGKEKSFLSALPVQALSFCCELDDRTRETFSQWGLRTLGDLASLQESSLVARLGEGGALLRRMARGEDVELLESYRPSPQFLVTKQLDWEVRELEPLFFIMKQLLEDLMKELKAQGRALERLFLCLDLADESTFEHEIQPAFPMQDPQVVLSLLRLDLQSRAPSSAVKGMTLEVFPAAPRIFQHSLLQPTVPHPEKWSQTLTRLQNIVGKENVGSPRLLDTHRPDAIRLGSLKIHEGHGGGRTGPKEYPLLSLRRFRPPRRIRLNSETILSCAGPWRSSGDWWKEGGAGHWAREEWDVELSDGAVYRIYWDPVQENWFVEGVYD